MRIISGTARGRKLASFDGIEVRPTPDRVREALFSLLTSRFGSLHGRTVLELFAGTGAQSLEAISRGAATAVVVDQHPDAIALIRDNTRRCGFGDAVTIIQGTLPACLPLVRDAAPFDLILMDPPYNSGLIEQLIEQIATLNLLKDSGIICAETARGDVPQYQGTIVHLQSRSYGSTGVHLFGYPKG
ncbi:MAG: 16S rRNA (guanine(966)-N(2))-methyltransferase RsmD [Pelovirga sp.]